MPDNKIPREKEGPRKKLQKLLPVLPGTITINAIQYDNGILVDTLEKIKSFEEKSRRIVKTVK